MLKRPEWMRQSDNASNSSSLDDEAPERPIWRSRAALIGASAIVAVVAAWFAYSYLIPTTAQVYRVERTPIVWSLKGPGLLDATNRVVLTARISGRLKWIGKDRNDPVESGEVVARLDDDDLKNQVVGARADSEAAQRAVVAAESNRARAGARLERLQLDVERRRKLIVTGSVSRAELDATEFGLKEAQAEVDGTKVAIARATAQAQAAAAVAAGAQARYEDATLRSPLNGLVVSRERNVGDVVTPGSPIVQLVDPASIIVSARFDESVMGVLRAGQAATISFSSTPDRAFAGKVVRIGRLVDQETREFLVDLSLDALPRNWALGQRTNVTIEVSSQAESPLVPMQYIQREEGKAGVWVLSGGHARWRPVLVRHTIGPVVEIEKGLDFGEVVIHPEGRYSGEAISPASNPS